MKHGLRAQMRDKRNAIPPHAYAQKSALVREKLESLEQFKKSEHILVYLSKEKEVDSHGLVRDLINKNKSVYAPKVHGQDLHAYHIHRWSDLEPGQFDILEPINHHERIPLEKLDLILVPGIAFTPDGHRIGYGKGYYDALLKDMDAIKIGLAFEEQIVDDFPREDHDIPVDIVITDQNIYQ
jgi:5-formyltetrahydrofolate cyclo-ligase